MSDNPFFDCLGSILSTKKYWLKDEKDYPGPGVNTGLSQHLDCVPYVNEINTNWRHLSNKMMYDYYFHSIRKMYRKYGKWAKKSKQEDIDLIQNYYQVNKQKAAQFLLILNDKQIEMIRSTYD